MKETNYNTVLDRIFIRNQVDGKWDNYTLREMLNYQKGLKRWLTKYTQDHIQFVNPKEKITEETLIRIIKILDYTGLSPVRIKEEKK